MLKIKSISCFDDGYFSFDGVYKIKEYQNGKHNDIGTYLIKEYDFRKIIFVTTRNVKLEVKFEDYYAGRLLIERIY